MTYAKNSTITAIHRPITNGMYNDTYTVIYSNGIRRNYTIKGAMNKKHFEFIQSATVESRYSKHTGKHTSDVFTAPVEPQEEPTTEEPAAEEAEAEEPTADEIGTALMAELDESLDYFKRVIYDYLDGTRYESDINGDFWGCHECWFLLFHMNAQLKTGGKTPFYALENEFCTLSECFEEIRCKYKYGDERTIENILEEYNLIKA